MLNLGMLLVGSEIVYCSTFILCWYVLVTVLGTEYDLVYIAALVYKGQFNIMSNFLKLHFGRKIFVI